MKPSLSIKAGRPYLISLLLLAPSIAALSKEEFAALADLIKETPRETLNDQYDEVACHQATAASMAMMTRFSNEAGMSEISEIVFYASLYMDSPEVMPVRMAKYEPSLLETYLPGLSGAIDAFTDVAKDVVLPTDPTISVSNPPSLLDSQGSRYSANWIRGMEDLIQNQFMPTEGGVANAARTGDQASSGTSNPASGLISTIAGLF